MSSLPTPLRRQLENAVKQARKVATEGARKALEALAVHEPEPYEYMVEEEQIELRSKLRAQAKQLGDRESLTKPGSCEIKHLIEKLAYDQWHRLLFARYLVENNLLISPEHGVSVSLDDCEELASSLGLKDAWAVAARFAAKELPEIFRADDPAGAVELPVENRKPLIQLVTGLPVEVFTASDSLGWCYQFWQAERKDEVNAAGNKIGADELPAVTQLFTEDYMVDFLLDNTMGAWHAGKWLAANPLLAETAESEDQLRAAVALPGCPWSYLRFIKDDDGKWVPAAGTFAGWPKTAKQVSCLDPCMGSGHFVVAIFERMVALRMAEEALDEPAAVAAVIRDNVFGLEIDPRCTQIAAFNLALTAWRHVGHCTLPAMNLACSGLGPNAIREDWLKLAGNDDRLRNGMDRLYRLFKDAPVLGSLINPRAGKGDLLVASFHEIQPLLAGAIGKEFEDDSAYEMKVAARGLAKAAEILVGEFTLIATNVPYLGRLKQNSVLKDYCEDVYEDSKADLAACFVERCLQFCSNGQGSTALVTPQLWLFLTTYTKLRRKLLAERSWSAVVSLGEEAWWTFGMRGPRTVLVVMSAAEPNSVNTFFSIDVSTNRGDTPILLDRKAARLSGREESEPLRVSQVAQLENPNASIVFQPGEQSSLLSDIAVSLQGTTTGDNPKFMAQFWEMPSIGAKWEFFQGAATVLRDFGACESIVRWEQGTGDLSRSPEARVQGLAAFGHRGLVVSQMGDLHATRYGGRFFSMNAAVVMAKRDADLPAIWCFLSSPAFKQRVRAIDQANKVTNASLVKVPFDLNHWRQVAGERYPNGLPTPFSSDPTQWLFNGHPKASDNPLQVAVARLLGYRWPRQTGSSFPDCPALGPDGLETLADAVGIVCLSATKGEPAAAERLRGLLAQAYGEDWSASVQQDLLAQVGYAGKTLDDWLRDGFFEQHCAFFHLRPSLHHRPFIWHIWDGNKNGFAALVNYHQLTYSNLEKLTYAYLGDWLRRQQAAVDAGEAGSDGRLQAAKQLQTKLKLILEGEPPYDIFVRWKPLSKQAIGWHPDLNDGVKMNIRPFAIADILRKRVKIKWDKDRGKEPVREKKEFPWFWGWDGTRDFAGAGKEPDGNRWNDCHYRNEFKRKARSE
jgi:hypothetical protein